MSSASSLVFLCLVILILLGLFLTVYSVLKLTATKAAGSKSDLEIPLFAGKSLRIKGPTWLILVAIGIMMIASPLLAAFAQKSVDVTTVPDTIHEVQDNESLPDENLDSFVFSSDLSIVDLREAQDTSWSHATRALFSESERKKLKPANVKNIMVLRKTKPAKELVLSYSSSGTLAVKCDTQQAKYYRRTGLHDGKETDVWAMRVDVSAIPINTDFQVVIEATYYNGFSDPNGSDYETYGNRQTEDERLSMLILFPAEKPMKTVAVRESAPTPAAIANLFSGASEEFRGPAGSSYYWTTTNTRSNYYYKVAWTW